MQHLHQTITRSFTFPSTRRTLPQDEVTRRRQTLNYDIWYRIALYLTTEDARHLSLVCKDCYAATLSRLLSSLEPTNVGNLHRMCGSLSTGIYYPAHLLQKLRVGRSALGASQLAGGWTRHRFDRGSPIPAALASLLEEAVNLRSLSLECVEDLIEADASVGDALVTLKSLDTVELLDIGPKTFEVAMQMQSRPTTLALHYESRDSSSNDLLRLLELPLLDRVRKLVLYRFQFGDIPVNASLPGMDRLHPWPIVEELHLFFCSTLPFYRLFPNLRVLSLWRVWRMADTDMALAAWPPAVPLLRATVDQHNVRCILGAPVRFLELKSYFEDRAATLLAVRETSPIILSLWCPERELTSSELWNGIVSAAQGPRARLRYLVVTFPGRVENGLRWLHEMAPLLSTLTLLCIRMIVVDVPGGYDAAGTVRGDANVPSCWRAFFRAVQGDLARAIPSLRFLSTLYVPKDAETTITYFSKSYEDEEFTWWRAATREGDDSAELSEQMPREVGDKIHQYLLSDAFEQTLSLDGAP